MSNIVKAIQHDKTGVFLRGELKDTGLQPFLQLSTHTAAAPLAPGSPAGTTTAGSLSAQV